MRQIAENLWLLAYPLSRLGADFRRNISIIRLQSGQLIIHSTGPFAPGDVAAISALGKPGWLVDAMLQHDTFAQEGRDAFPTLPYLAPEGFSTNLDFPTGSLLPPPAEWENEVDVLRIEGVPAYQEHVFLHRRSRTLIVADLIFNFGPDEPAWTEILLRVAVGSEHHPGMSRPFRAAIKDEAAFRASMETVLGWDFDRMVVGHGDFVESHAREKIEALLKHLGL